MRDKEISTSAYLVGVESVDDQRQKLVDLGLQVPDAVLVRLQSMSSVIGALYSLLGDGKLSM